MSLPALGIDISKEKFDVVLLLQDETLRKSFTNNQKGFKQLQDWLKKKSIQTVHACMEATSHYGDELALFLYKQEHQVSVVNPARIKGHAQSKMVRNKTDASDAFLIADFCATQKPGIWTPPSEEVRHLQALLRRLETLQKMKQMEENRLESLSKEKEILCSIKRIISSLNKEIERVKKAISSHIDNNPRLKKEHELLTTIPGIATTTAAWLLGEIELHNFKSAKEVAAFAGLSPKRNQSGSSLNGKTRVCKIGNKRLRKILYMPAIVAKRFNPIVKDFCLRLEERGKQKMQIVCAAMRKLIHIAFGVVKFSKPFDPTLAFSS